MTLSDLGNIGELVGAIGVVASLIYVGLEVRRNTTALRAQAHESVVAGYMTSVQLFNDHAEVMAKGLSSSYAEFQHWPAPEKLIFFGNMYCFFKHFEQLYAQYGRGLIAEDEWDAWNEHVRMQFHQPGTQWWWQLRRASFAHPFRAYLERSRPPAMPTLASLMREHGGDDAETSVA